MRRHAMLKPRHLLVQVCAGTTAAKLPEDSGCLVAAADARGPAVLEPGQARVNAPLNVLRVKQVFC